MKEERNAGRGPEPKWAVLVDDATVWSPSRRVNVGVLKQQGGANGRVLVRDHNSPDDVVIADGEVIDLASGNVFYTLDQSEVQPRSECREPAKLAFFVDDRHELTTKADQTGATLRSLFSLQANVRLVRDFDSPRDEEVEPSHPASFADGPVFVTRKVEHKLQITVNARIFSEQDGVKKKMTGLEIAALVYPQNAADTTVNQISPEAREVALTAEVHIRGGEVFQVCRKNVTGGFTNDRIDRELAALTAGAQRMTLVKSPAPAVIYHELPTRAGAPVAKTDVLVLIPSAYPGQMIDGAYLPHGSPLIGRVKGSPQGEHVDADGRRWQLISYHPHNGGGGPAWNPGVHGFHTYLSEILSWLSDLQ